MTFQKINTSLVLIIFFAVQYTASTQNNTNIHFVIEETSFDRLCQSKKILTINGRFPGPTIYARAGETLALDIENKGKDNVTMFCCRGTGSRHVKFDQVEWLVEAGSKVRKNITISDDDEGTLWWHALDIWQRATVHGAFIVHPKPGTNQALPFSMPHDHVDIPIILGEWWKKDVKEIFLEYVDSGGDINSDAFTINGQPGDFYPCSNNGTFRIEVDIGKKYLLRVVNAAMSKTLYFGIARHNLTVIAMDGSPITEPFTTDYIELTIQHSIDCIFEANQQPNYYYMVDVMNISEVYDTNKITTAIIEYQGSYIPSLPPLLPLLPNFSPNYDKSSSRDYLYVIMTFVILGLFFCTTCAVWYRQTNRAHRSAMVTPM
ncbi:laccase-14-like [Solanum stenotomum]|uniref:laccase-14-like n=1 Tax=Solanum stenotomum TaxID=172797 RepID=UPI0020D1F0E2|nr:laccase-14-like [Solanum stenotomum]